jgi:hypothetical protein
VLAFKGGAGSTSKISGVYEFKTYEVVVPSVYYGEQLITSTSLDEVNFVTYVGSRILVLRKEAKCLEQCS